MRGRIRSDRGSSGGDWSLGRLEGVGSSSTESRLGRDWAGAEGGGGRDWKRKKRSSLGWTLGLEMGRLGLGEGEEEEDLWLRIHSVALRVDLPPVAAKA